MMQPIINKGDINVQELVNIYDETEETEETDELNNQIDDKNIDNYEGNVINGLEQRVQENKVMMVNKPVKVNVDKKKEKKDKNEDNILANMLDNALDNVINLGQPNDEKKETYAEFGQNYNNSNVISEIIPIKKVESHFDKDNYPNEVYKAIMLNGKVEEYKANDIHSYSLETHKYIYEHNQQITRTKANKTNGFIYARCSTTNDISIETQRQACFAYAKAMNIKLVSYGYQYDNNVSARNMNNLKYELGFWEKRIPEDGNLIIYSVDRLSRDLVKGIQFLEKLVSRGIQIHFVFNEIIYKKEMSAAAKSMVQQELQTAEKYSNIISEKIKGTLKRLRAEGHDFGRARYGYKSVKINGIRKHVVNDLEQKNIKKIIKRYHNYIEHFETYPENIGFKKTYTNIMHALRRWCNRSGLKYRNDKHYTINQLKKITDSDIVSDIDIDIDSDGDNVPVDNDELVDDEEVDDDEPIDDEEVDV